MLKLRNHIQRLNEKCLQQQREQWSQSREQVKRIRDELNRTEHKFYTNRFGEIHHDKRCHRCELGRQAAKMRLEEFEQLLPKSEAEQLAVVFELRIPNIIACLRDVLYSFAKLCPAGEPQKLKIKGYWIECEKLHDLNQSTSTCVHLGSTKKRHLEYLHVDNNFNAFIVSNSFNCVYEANDEALPKSPSDAAAKRMNAFKTQDEYLGLQWTLNGTEHTENEVLSRQSECPRNLSLNEFKIFGSLRADGHRLQLRKLFAVIETEALSFEKESVLLLVMQVLWECGISGAAKAIRESHIDFNDPIFCTAVIELLDKFVCQQEDNWMHPFKLLMSTVIAVRAFEMNDSETVADEIIEFINRIRSIIWDWIEKIERVIHEARNPNETSQRELRLKLIYVAITGALTFNVHRKHAYYSKIFTNVVGANQRTAVNSWLHFIIVLRNNINLYENQENALPTTLRILLRLTEISGINSEPKVKELINTNLHSVFNLIKMHWLAGNQGSLTRMNFVDEFPHILFIETIFRSITHYVEIDVIKGLFFVNGLPLSRLPYEMTQHEMFQRVFGNASFEVQRDASNRYCTIQKNSEFTYEFEHLNGNLIIWERSANNSDYVNELIPFSELARQFPYMLIRHYVHWWNKQANCIEFRQRSHGQRNYMNRTPVDYEWNLASKQLVHVKSKRPLMNFKHATYKRIAEHLVRLEDPKYMHVFMDAPRVVSVELSRMKLKFELDCSAAQEEFFLESKEFHGMRVSRTQRIGTLYGLSQGLVLESGDVDSSRTRILLIPHGSVNIVESSAHIFVNIDTTETDIRTPPFYKYQVNEFCRHLTASDSSHASWFYLAYLHAITSHGEAEPLLGMSGTERALQILQSAFAWSASPYETEAIRMLHEIAKLSPIRRMNEYSQSVTWPEDISHRSAQDSFVLIVKKLLDDSERLHGLHAPVATMSEKLVPETDLLLNERDYRRCLQMQPNLRVNDSFIEHSELETSLPKPEPFEYSYSTQVLSLLYHKKSYKVPSNLHLRGLLVTERSSLKGTVNENCISNILHHSEYETFADLWLSLYEAVRNEELTDEELALILTLFAHQKEPLDPILAIQTVAWNPDAFEDIDPPDVELFQLSSGTYNEEQIAVLLESFRVGVLERHSKTSDVLSFNDFINGLIVQIGNKWPCASVDLQDQIEMAEKEFKFNLIDANIAINQQLNIWHNNHMLYNFISDVENRMSSLPASGISRTIPPYVQFGESKERKWIKFRIDVERKTIENLNAFDGAIAEATNVWVTNERDSPKSSKDWWAIIVSLMENCDKTKHLSLGGLLPRTVPSLLLPKIVDANTDARLRALIGAFALAIAREQREKRIALYAQRPELAHDMEKELENEAHTNWMPHERPEWILFEIEQNLTIRKIQIEIANRMIEPPKRKGVDATHSVMQLNMGEGKTAVIVPILAVALADGQQACQITILKPLFARNLKSLRQYLGGLLNRKLYTFPCRRDKPVEQYIEQMLAIYEECRAQKGVILTLPEYRLSGQLKIYEATQKDDFDLAKSFLNAHQWINANVRNIMDESDAILQANYQLIYTMGNQLPPDGGSQRWCVAQAVLKRIPCHMNDLYRKYGKEMIEFDSRNMKNAPGAVNNLRTDIFTPCRILDETIFDDLKAAIVADFFAGKLEISFTEVAEATKQNIRDIICTKVVDRSAFYALEGIPLNDQNTILILSGLLRFEVLKLVLQRRWRVNYGVDPNGDRKMAIPFKAKDVAAEKTEFGHPDVAICYTQLSYYYSGLSDAQLYQLFEVLEGEPNAPSIYAKWIQSIPIKLVNGSIRSYTGINLDDCNQRDGLLFPLLRFNMYAIDFWLSSVVFPHEAKIFEQKLMCTAWDLCGERLNHPVTGFSGTNDTKNILPLTVAQNDLEELENTNESMRQVLLLPENQSYEALPDNVSGKQILERLTKHGIPVLLDSGALMLELTNEQVTSEWLKMTPEGTFDVAVYFDSRDILQTIDRNGAITDFDCSVYRENLNRCLVYLDDVHTRGTDLKFPMNWKACVTLSGDITRDKTVQSCMRMRQLGRGHSISLWASYEADIRIRKLCNLSGDDPVDNEHVIKFIVNNSRQLEQSNMIHWTAAALNYTKKSIGHKLFENSTDANAMKDLYDICVDNEFVTLQSTYGGDKEEALLTNIAWAKFDRLGADFKSNREIRNYVRDIQDSVYEKLQQQAADVRQFSHALSEEQEKELEQELEEQRFLERPPAVKAATPAFDKRLERLFRDGATDDIIAEMKSQRSLFTVATSLARTQLFRRYKKKNKDAWSDHLLLTGDFDKVIDSKSQACDEFLRPVWWVAAVHNPNGRNYLILLSSFECNRLLPVFRKTKNSALFMYRPRLSKLHSNLLEEAALQVSDMDMFEDVDIHDEVQIGMYAGSMYFASEDEQNAYCAFMGLIPRPRATLELEQAAEKGIIQSKAFVPMENRHQTEAIENCVGRCKFNDNPVDLAIKLIEAHHQTLIKESHVASILEQSTKMVIEDDGE
ncbi:hypothetical protein HA402_006536 [Bradysia odoriphaga]|nr:hypothetical protein HA402_006536 [Bradysia odoriphaga]